MSEYEQDDTIRLYATFLTLEGEAAIISGVPVITISHKGTAATTKTDINSGIMTQLIGTTYYYEYHIPVRADKTIYNVRYGTEYADNTHVLGSEEFQVIPKKFYSKIGGGFVQKFKDVWTIEEKKELLKAIDNLLKKIEAAQSELIINKDFLQNLGSRYKVITMNLSENADIIKKQHTNYQNLIEELKKLQVLQESLPDIQKSEGKKLIHKLTELEYKIKETIEHDKMPLVISELEDLRIKLEKLKEELDDFKAAFAKSLPEKLMEEIVVGKN